MLTTLILPMALLFGAATSESYTELYRPQYHFTPEKNWMNDPNGLLYHNSIYHLYYQYNPNGAVWGDISWGHATSPDLTHWTQHPIAIEYDADDNGTTTAMFFSGSAVADTGRTSGFCKTDETPIVAIFTIYYPTNQTASGGREIRAGQQSQGIAYSCDDGMTFTKYADNPVILDPPNKYADQWENFRDPFVFWYAEGNKWVMLNTLANSHILNIYESFNLKKWTHLSYFGPYNAVGGQWECPNLFPLPSSDGTDLKWVIMAGINPGGPTVGSATQYFVGDFDGTTFTPDADTIITNSSVPTLTGIGAANWVDYGPDFYAAATYNGLADNERVAIGWMSNWAYATITPTSPWRSAMAFPRYLTLGTTNGKTNQLISQPVSGLQSLEQTGSSYARYFSKVTKGTTVLPNLSGKTLDLNLTFPATGNTAGAFGLAVRKQGTTQQTFIGYDFISCQMYVDRVDSGNTSFSLEFPGTYYAPLEADEDGTVAMRVLVDWSSVEVFGGRGGSSITAQVFPGEMAVHVALFAEGGYVKHVEVEAHGVVSAWTS